MSWFRKSGPPPWSPFDERGDQIAFDEAVKRALRDRRLEMTDAARQAGVVELPDGLRWDLKRLAERCLDLERDAYYSLVYEDLKRVWTITEQRTGLDQLRSQIVSRDNPLFGALAMQFVVHRPLVGQLVEVAMWDLADAAEHTVRRGDARLAGQDDDAVLMRARTQSIRATSDTIRFMQVALAGAAAEIAVSNAYYLGACMVETLAHGDPQQQHVIAPVSWHHWVVHAVTADTTREALVAMQDLARTILAQTPLSVGERLGETLLWWPGNGRPEVIAIADGQPAPTAAMLAKMPGWR